MRTYLFTLVGVFLVLFSLKIEAQTVSLSWETPASGEVTKPCGGGLLFQARRTGVANIRINVAGFCSPTTFDWEVLSYIPALGTCVTPLAQIQHPTSGVFQNNPPPCTNPPTAACNPDANIRIFNPGFYTFRLCVTSTACSQSACAEITLRALPPTNFPPELTMEDITELTLPIANTERLEATVTDPTDLHTFYWVQAGANPMTITLPNPGDGAGNPVSRPRGSNTANTEVDISQITKPGNYCFTLNAADEFGATSSASDCFLVKPATSTLGINITPPGVAPDPNVLIAPVNNVPLNSQITGINVFNDRILYTWSQIAGPTTIPLPPPAYTANVNDLPVASSTFNVPPLNLNALAYGTYTLRLRAEDEYYPGTFVEQDITFQVRPPESNLDVTVNPAAVTTIDPYTNFPFSGRVTGINAGSDVIRTYWRQDAANPVQFTSAPFNETIASPNVVPVGTTELTSNGTLNSRITAGTYVFWYVARDIFYNVADSAKIELIVEPGRSNFQVSIDPSGEKAITKTLDGWIINTGENPQNITFNVTGRTTGISDKTDFVRTYWRMSFVPDASGETQNPTLPHTAANPKEIPLGTTSDESNLGFTLIHASGEYDIWYVARDLFYNTADSANLKLLIRRPVAIQPLAAFTPNGDGFNDVWTIRNIESFPDVGVRIVNERGELVFETSSVAQLPERGWDGRRRDGKVASEGAYYYQFFDNRDQTLITAGSFIILR
jgi:gliding motility-associated-like protein